MKIIEGNIVSINTDAIACPAHSDLKIIPGIREAVFKAADTERLKKECLKTGYCRICNTVITSSCGLPSKYIIHIAGPGWYSGRPDDRKKFALCYMKVLSAAYYRNFRSIALPLMFSGETHMPRNEALKIVIKIIKDFEKQHHNMDITLVLHKESIYKLAKKIYEDMK